MDTVRPNILLAIADDWAWPHAGAYGCDFVTTAAFDRVACEGVLFENAFTTAPTCTASRASLLTGQHPWSLGAGAQLWGYLPARHPVYPELLAAAGYWIGHTNKGWGPGNLEASGRSENPAGPAFNRHRCTPLTTHMSSNDYAANFADFLERKPADAPFCFWYGAKEPHRAYEAGSGIRHGKRLADVQVPPYLPDCEEVRSDLLDYALETERFDADLGAMLDLLEQRGDLENTIVVVTGDNGKPFPRAKATAYEHGCHVPLAIRCPGACPGRAVSDLVSFIDLAPTFLELAGLPSPPLMAGRSLVNVLTSPAAGRVDATRDSVIIGRERHGYSRPWNVGYPIRALVTDTHLYIRNYEPERWPGGNPERYGDCDNSPSKQHLLAHQQEHSEQLALCFGKRPAEELYLRPDDPACLHNLAPDPQAHDLCTQLRQRLETALDHVGDPRVQGRGWQFDCVPYLRPAETEIPEDFPRIDPKQVQMRRVPPGETLTFDLPAHPGQKRVQQSLNAARDKP